MREIEKLSTMLKAYIYAVIFDFNKKGVNPNEKQIILGVRDLRKKQKHSIIWTESTIRIFLKRKNNLWTNDYRNRYNVNY